MAAAGRYLGGNHPSPPKAGLLRPLGPQHHDTPPPPPPPSLLPPGWLQEADSGALWVQVIPSTCRAMIGCVAGGGRIEKPMLKAGNSYHKYKVKRNSWPKVRLFSKAQRGRHIIIVSSICITDQIQCQLGAVACTSFVMSLFYMEI